MTPRTERERIERVVRKVTNSCVYHDGLSHKYISVIDARNLLCRELAKERGRVRRIIGQLQLAHALGLTRCVEVAQYDHAYRMACDDLLAALRGKKGK